jgi:hypothetical protein
MIVPDAQYSRGVVKRVAFLIEIPTADQFAAAR